MRWGWKPNEETMDLHRQYKQNLSELQFREEKLYLDKVSQNLYLLLQHLLDRKI